MEPDTHAGAPLPQLQGGDETDSLKIKQLREDMHAVRAHYEVSFASWGRHADALMNNVLMTLFHFPKAELDRIKGKEEANSLALQQTLNISSMKQGTQSAFSDFLHEMRPLNCVYFQ